MEHTAAVGAEGRIVGRFFFAEFGVQIFAGGLVADRHDPLEVVHTRAKDLDLLIGAAKDAGDIFARHENAVAEADTLDLRVHIDAEDDARFGVGEV